MIRQIIKLIIILYLGIVSATGLSGLLAPGTFDILPVEVCIVDRDDGLCGWLFRRESKQDDKKENEKKTRKKTKNKKHSSKVREKKEKIKRISKSQKKKVRSLVADDDSPNKGVSLVFEDADLLDLTVWSENFLQGFLGGSLGQIAAVDGAVGRGWLAKDFLVRHGFGSGWEKRAHRNEKKKQTKKGKITKHNKKRNETNFKEEKKKNGHCHQLSL